MSGERGSPLRAQSRYDSSPIILHARQTVFVMLIVSALVAMAVLAEDVARPKRAVEDAKFVAGLMEFWHAETENKDVPVSVATIIAGPVARTSKTDNAFELELTELYKDSDGNEATSKTACTVDLNIERRYIVPGQGPVRDIVIEPSATVKSGGEFRVSWHNYEGKRLSGGWSLTRNPNDLEDFSRLWDLLVSSSHSTHILADNLEDRIKQGVIIQKPEATRQYQIANLAVVNSSGDGETYIVQEKDFLLSEHSNLGLFGLLASVGNKALWIGRMMLWKKNGFDAIAISPCREQNGHRRDPLQFAFPVQLVKEKIDWTKAWIRSTEEWIRSTRGGGELSKQLHLEMEDKAGFPFSEAFSDLRS